MIRFARLQNSISTVEPKSENNPLPVPAEVRQQVFEPREPRQLLHGLLEIVQRCGVSASPEQTVVAVIMEVDRWEVLGDEPGQATAQETKPENG